jgi:hypothetical protein
MTAGNKVTAGKVRSEMSEWGGQRVILEMLPGFRMTLLLLN